MCDEADTLLVECAGPKDLEEISILVEQYSYHRATCPECVKRWENLVAWARQGETLWTPDRIDKLQDEA
jgi:hypothetical protein